MDTKQEIERAAQEYQDKIDREMEKDEPDATLIDLLATKRDALQFRAVYARDERDN